MIVFAEFSSGNPYFSQNAAVSAKSGSISTISYATPVESRNEVTRDSTASDSEDVLTLLSGFAVMVLR